MLDIPDNLSSKVSQSSKVLHGRRMPKFEGLRNAKRILMGERESYGSSEVLTMKAKAVSDFVGEPHKKTKMLKFRFKVED